MRKSLLVFITIILLVAFSGLEITNGAQTVINALDYFPVNKEASYLAENWQNGSYWYSDWIDYRAVVYEGISYLTRCTTDLFFGDGVAGRDFYNIYDYQGEKWICRVGQMENKNGTYSLKRLNAPEPEMPVSITLGKTYSLNHSLFGYKFTLQDVRLIEGAVLYKSVLVRENIWNIAATQIINAYAKNIGWVAVNYGKEWSGFAVTYNDTKANRDILRQKHLKRTEDKYGDSDLVSMLNQVKSYTTYSDVLKLFKIRPYKAGVYEKNIYGVGGPTYWRENGRDICIVFSKRDLVDLITVDDGSFYYRDL